MRRNLRFWARYTWEGMQVVVLVLAILLVLSAVGASRLELAALATSAPAYLLLAAGMTIIMLNYSAQAVYTPLLLSMGETRRNIFLGYHFYRVLIIVVAVGLSALIWALVPGEIARLGLRNIPSILAILVIVSALGGIIGTLYAKWRGAATVMLVVVFGILGGVGGFSFAGGGEDVARLVERAASTLAEFPWWLMLAAVGALALDVCFQWLLLRRQEARL